MLDSPQPLTQGSDTPFDVRPRTDKGFESINPSDKNVNKIHRSALISEQAHKNLDLWKYKVSHFVLKVLDMIKRT